MKRVCLTFFASLLLSVTVTAQVAINTDNSDPDPSAMLDIKSNTMGLLIPRMTEAEKLAIPSPAEGLIIYQTDGHHGVYINHGTPSAPAWTKVNTAGTALWEYNAAANTIHPGSATNKLALGLTGASRQLHLSESIQLPNTTDADTGIIFKDGVPFIHNYKSSMIYGQNTFVGTGAGNMTLSGSGSEASYNTAIGAGALSSITTGSSNVAVGADVLSANNTGKRNSSVGDYSMPSNQNGNSNSAFGVESMFSNVSGSSNTAMGDKALSGNQSGDFNAALGAEAGNASKGNNNVYLGARAASLHSTGDDNVFIGYDVASNMNSGSNNIIIGSGLQPPSTYLSNQLYIGGLIYGIMNLGRVGIGTVAPQETLDINGNIMLSGSIRDANFSLGDAGQLLMANGAGIEWMDASTIDDGDWIKNGNDLYPAASGGIGIGTDSPASELHVLDSLNNCRVEFESLNGTSVLVMDGTSGLNQIRFEKNGTYMGAFGYNLDNGNLFMYEDGNVVFKDGQMAIGTGIPTRQLTLTKSLEIPETHNSSNGILFKGTTAFLHDYSPASSLGQNVFMGKNAGNFTMTGPYNFSGCSNVGIGANAMNSNTEGFQNAAVGTDAMANNTKGNYNTAFGGFAMHNVSEGDYNVAIGKDAAYGAVNSNASKNIAIGYRSGYYLGTGSDENILIGYKAGDDITTGSGNIIIGNGINPPDGTEDNQMNIGNLLFGDMANGRLGIGTDNPVTNLHILNETDNACLRLESQTSNARILMYAASGQWPGIEFRSNGVLAAGLFYASPDGDVIINNGLDQLMFGKGVLEVDTVETEFFRFNLPKTCTLNIPPCAFTLNDNQEKDRIVLDEGRLGMMDYDDRHVRLQAPLTLPTGAVIKELGIYYINYDNLLIQEMTLFRRALTNRNSIPVGNLNNVPTSSVITYFSIPLNLLFDDNHYYFLELDITDMNLLPVYEFYGARVIYEISELP